MKVQYISINNASVNNLRDISIKIPLNQYVVFVGKSGSGKSTLAENVIMNGYHKKDPNVDVPLKPLLFRQKQVMPNNSISVSDYLGLNGQSIISCIKAKKSIASSLKETIISVGQWLRLDEYTPSLPISKLSLTAYNKLRFFRLLLKQDSKLIIIDELAAGLTISESYQIAKCFRCLVDNGYSVLVVEHSLPVIAQSDYVIELGPDAGRYGGEILFQGTTTSYIKTPRFIQMVSVLKKNNSSKNKQRRKIDIHDIRFRNLQGLDLSIPLNGIVTICGKTGSGKSSLLDIIFRACDKSPSAWKNRYGIEGNIEGKDNIRRPYYIDQSPIGNNSMSTPATYTGIMESIRTLYVNNAHGLDKSVFSYNSIGKCPNCGGKGSYELRIDDEIILQPCEACHGKRYNERALEIKESNISIGEALMLSCLELYDIYSKDIKKRILTSKIGFLNNIGLSYLCLGQPSGSLSGGESQRIKITKELSKKLGDRCLFILDSPSKGLHMLDLPLLYNSLNNLTNKNNSIIIADNNPFLFHMSDWVIFLEKGKIIYEGQPEKCHQTLLNQIEWRY